MASSFLLRTIGVATAALLSSAAAVANPPLPLAKPPVPAMYETPPQVVPRPDDVAKYHFGRAESAAALPPRAIGTYGRGCLAGAKKLAYDGPS